MIPFLLGGSSRSSSASSRLPDESSTMRRQQLLLLAKETYEVATSIDPTNPIVRSGLGLSYLLLGMIDDDDADDVGSSSNDKVNDDSSMQYIVQSIQHLKAAVQLTEEEDEDDGREWVTVSPGNVSSLGNGTQHNNTRGVHVNVKSIQEWCSV